MKIIEPSAKLVTGYDRRPEELIELCGRICYNSQDKIADGTAQKFCEMLRKNGHTSVFEHANFIFDLSACAFSQLTDAVQMYSYTTGKPSYIRRSGASDGVSFYASGNARAWLDLLSFASEYEGMGVCVPRGIIDALCRHKSIFGEIADLKRAYLGICIQRMPEQLPQDVWERHTTATFFITCDRGISHELVRHRAASVSQQSTRYCKANASGEIEIIKPSGLSTCYSALALNNIEAVYDDMLANGIKPQIARCILPTCLATKLYMTMTIERWRDFLALRTSPAAHPDMRVIAKQIQAQLFGERGAQNDNSK